MTSWLSRSWSWVTSHAKPKTNKRREFFPASVAQQGLWFLDQLYPENPAYNMSQAFRLQGSLDREALLRSINTIIERHAALRTVFVVQDHRPVQAVQESLKIELPIVDLVEQHVDGNPAKVQQLIDDEVRRPIDLEQGPLIRAVLLKLATDDHLFLIIEHHMIFDRTSEGLLMQELTTLYNSDVNGEPSLIAALSDLPRQYSDYTQWRLDKNQGEAQQLRLSYWKKQLQAISPLDLPTDHPRSSTQSTTGERQYLDLPQQLVENFAAIARQNGATRFMGLLAVFKVLLHQWTGNDDITVGTPFADRRLSGTTKLIGFFVNTLVLRTDSSGDPDFCEFLQRVRKVCFDAYRHNAVPFESLVEELKPERQLNRNPLFDVQFAYHKARSEKLALGDVSISSMTASKGSSQYDLTLTVREKTEGYDARIEYRTDLFEFETIRWLLQRFSALLQAISTDPLQRLSDLPPLSRKDQRRIVTE